jgi:hypothetical protein
MRKNILFNLMLVLFLGVAFSGCEMKPLCYLDHPHNPNFVHTAFTVKFNSAWDNQDLQYLDTADHYNVRITMEFWTVNSSGNADSMLVRQQIVGAGLIAGDNSQVVNVDLPARPMKAIVWADLVKKGETTNAFFDVSNLTAVKELSIGFNEDKDAFSNAENLDYSQYSDQPEGVDVTAEITLLRPFACYRLVANDYQKYLEEKGQDAPVPSFTNVAYQLWIPMEYNCFTQRPQQATTSQSYKYMSGPGNGIYYPLASDMVFVGTADAEYQYYNLLAAVYDTNSILLTTSANISAKLLRNKITYIYGPFLTTSNIGGAGVNDKFDDYVDIVIPD